MFKVHIDGCDKKKIERFNKVVLLTCAQLSESTRRAPRDPFSSEPIFATLLGGLSIANDSLAQRINGVASFVYMNCNERTFFASNQNSYRRQHTTLDKLLSNLWG